MARYAKVDVRIWDDERVKRLSPIQPSGQGLWVRLLISRHRTSLPGLLCVGRAALAEELGWALEDFDVAFSEIESSGMAKADWKARVIWIPNAIRFNEPENPNVVSSWRTWIDEVPECDLTREATESIHTYLQNMGDEWVAAWNLSESKVYRPRKIPGTIRKAIQNRDGNKCRYCGKKVDWADHRGPLGGTLDHINPAGSSFEDNLVVACRKCNSFKGFRTPQQAGMVIIEKLPELSGKLPEPTEKPSCNQEQEQEQDQEQEQEKESPSVGACDPCGTGTEHGITPKHMQASAWHFSFGIAWRNKFGKTYAHQSDSVARGRFDEMLDRLETEDVLEVWNRKDEVFAEFLGSSDRRTQEAGHQFSFFASNFLFFMIPKEKRPQPKPSRPDYSQHKHSGKTAEEVYGKLG